jgi:hypothetical protein
LCIGFLTLVSKTPKREKGANYQNKIPSRFSKLLASDTLVKTLVVVVDSQNLLLGQPLYQLQIDRQLLIKPCHQLGTKQTHFPHPQHKHGPCNKM